MFSYHLYSTSPDSVSPTQSPSHNSLSRHQSSSLSSDKQVQMPADHKWWVQQVARYKRNEGILTEWLTGTAETTYDRDANPGPRAQSWGQLYERFVNVVEHAPEQVRGIVVPADVLVAAWTALYGRTDCDKRKKDMLLLLPRHHRARGGPRDHADNEEADDGIKRAWVRSRRHRHHTYRLRRVVATLQKPPFVKKTTTTTRTRQRSQSLPGLSAQPFLPLNRTMKCP